MASVAKPKKLLLIDGMAAVYRAYYALNRNPRLNSKGLNTSAILGFTNTVYDLLKQQNPTHIGIAFDLRKPTFRHEIYAEYKANRDAMPEEIQTALPYVFQIIEAFRIPLLTAEGFEADDVIGTLSHEAEKAGFDKVVMATPDKDFGQLVTDHVVMYRYGRMGNPDQILGVEEVKERFGVNHCKQVIDLLGLWGDASDNIPGIPGIGEKTAKKLIDQFGSIEEMVLHVDEIKNEKIRNLVRTHGEQALFSKMLATIRLDVSVSFDEEALLRKVPDYNRIKELFDELEFRNLAKRIYTDLSITDPDLAVRFQQRRVKESQVAKEKSTVEEPTLFDAPTLFDDHPNVPEHKVSLLDQLPQSGDISIFLQGSTIAIAKDADWAYVCQVGDFDIPALKSLLEEPSTLKICYDLKSIKYLMNELDIHLQGNIFDVQLAHYLIDAEARHSFDFICSAILSTEPDGTAASASALWMLYPMLSSKLREGEMTNLYTDIELPLVDVLIAMEKEGVRIDVEAIKDYASRLTAERDVLEKEIYALADYQFNISSPKQLGEVLFERLKVTDKPPRTATKQYSTAEDVLLKLKDRHPIIEKILEYRSLNKLIGTYLTNFPKLVSPDTGRLHTVYNQTVTATGRLSSSNPNLQNIPIRTERGKEIRRAFVARNEDYLLLAADYSQIELRIIASLAHDKHLIEAFQNRYDIHAATASRIYQVPMEEVTKDLRRNAKSVNFGIVYGISPFGLSEQLGISRKEAATLIEDYFTQYPDIKKYIESNIQFAHEHSYAQTLLGRRRYLYDINSRNNSARSFAERNAVNMPIQGTSADMIKIAMVRIYQRFKELGLKSKMILQVHDELVFDLYRPEEAKVRTIVEEEMVQALQLPNMPIEVGIEVGNNWLDAH